jgi:colanic acid biosynthesis glycosyl transferase WcaI
MSLKTLLGSVNFAPEKTGIGKYSGDIAAWLAERGHSVPVVAAAPHYPMRKMDPAGLMPRFRRGVDVWRAPLWVPNKPGGTARVLHLLSFAITSFRQMLRQVFWRPVIVVVAVAPAFGVCSDGIADRAAVRRKNVAALTGFRSRRGVSIGPAEGQAGASLSSPN